MSNSKGAGTSNKANDHVQENLPKNCLKGMDDNLTKNYNFHDKQVKIMIMILLIKPCQISPWSIGSCCCYVVYVGDCYTSSFLQDDGGGGGPGGGGGGGGGGAPIRGGGPWNI